MRPQLRLALKLAVSAVALALAFRDLDLARLVDVGRSANWPLVLAAAALSIVSVGLLALRWKQILAPLVTPPLAWLYCGHYIGLFGNNVFPLRAGEFMRADYLRKRTGTSFLAILGSILIERVIDLIVVALMFLALTATVSIPRVPTNGVALLVGAAALIAASLAFRFRDALAGLVRRRFQGIVDAQVLVRSLLTLRGLSGIALSSLGIWLLYFVRFQAVLSAIGLPLDPVLVVLLLVAAAAGFLIPAAPGALGTYHVAVVFSMHDIYDVPLLDAQAAALLLHLSAYVPTTAIGLGTFLASDNRRRA